jgi:predicted O-linked N-acetylglucosamine transferase (SPINDLY family)
VLLQQGHGAEAAERIRRAVAAAPADLDAWSNLALAYQAVGRHDMAIDALTEATRRAPRDPDLLANLAGVLLDADRPTDAERAARRAIDASTSRPRGWFNLALALQKSGRGPEALVAARRAAALDANMLAAVGLEAQLQDELGDLAAAGATLEVALARVPGALPLRFQLADVLQRDGRIAAAAAAFEAVLRAQPGHGAALSQLLFLRKRMVDWHDLDELRAAFRAGVRGRMPMLSPFCLLSDPSTRAEQRRCAETWVDTTAPPLRSGSPASIVGGGSRLRVGYLSADFHSHATAFLAAGVFEAHDRSRFEIVGYSTGPDDGSPMRARLEAAFGGLVDTRGWPAERLAARIRDDRIDILVDLKGHTEGAPTAAIARRPAPIQVQWLGYPATMGAPYVDYLIGDAIVTPFEHADDYTETLVHLPHTYQPNTRARPIAECPPREELGLPRSAVVFCCFNNPYKFNPQVFDAVARIAAAVPGSVFWFLARGTADPAIGNLREEAARRGIASERLAFATARPNAQYLALYREADLFLDTWPYNGHTTVSDALWAGCPVVTLLGATFAGRVAASLLTAVGRPELIARDADAYVDLAIALGRDPARRAVLRAYLDGPGHASALFDTSGTTRAIESAYLEMAAQHRAGIRKPFRVDHPAG